MSSILKALKKLEHEKSGRFPDSLKIDSDILRSNDSSRSFTPFVVALLFLLVFGGGATVAFFFLKETKVPQSTAASQQTFISTALQPPVIASVASHKALPAKTATVPAHKEPTREAVHEQQQKTAAAGKAADTITKKPTGTIVSGTPEKPKEVSIAAHREPPAATEIPALRVNGIAFQNSAADSMAIVNGVTVSSGSIIEGVTIEEVRKDRVLFKRNSDRFEIQLGQSNQ